MKIKRFASILTIPSALLILYHLGLLVFNYSTLSKGEGWGVVAVLGALLWLLIILSIGTAIRVLIKSARIKWIMESVILLFLVLFVIVNQ